MIFNAINLIILLAIVIIFGRKKMNAHFEKKREELEGNMKAAAEELEKIERAHSEIKKKMQDLSTTLQRIQKEFEEEMDRESKKIQTDTDSYVRKLVSDGAQKLDQEVARAKKDFEADLVKSAFQQAEVLIQRKLEKTQGEFLKKVVAESYHASKEKKNYAT